MSQVKFAVTQIYSRFKFVQVLKETPEKITYLMQSTADSRNYILKIYYLPSESSQQKLKLTIKLLNQITLLKSPFILKFYEASYDKNLTYVALLQEECSQPLDQYLAMKGSLQEREIWLILVKVSGGLNILHSQGKVHGKVKASNIFLQDDSYKLGEPSMHYHTKGDFGKHQQILSPEFVRHGTHTLKSDVWLLGCVLYELMYRQPPFWSYDQNVLKKKILQGKAIQFHNDFSKNLNNLIQVLLCQESTIRPDTESLMKFCQEGLYADSEIDLSVLIPREKIKLLLDLISDLGQPRQQSNKSLPRIAKEDSVKNSIYFSNPGAEQSLPAKFFRPSKVRKNHDVSRSYSVKRKNKLLSVRMQEFAGEEATQENSYRVNAPRILKGKYLQSRIARKAHEDEEEDQGLPRIHEKKWEKQKSSSQVRGWVVYSLAATKPGHEEGTEPA